jgi:hypothetical protein
LRFLSRQGVARSSLAASESRGDLLNLSVGGLGVKVGLELGERRPLPAGTAFAQIFSVVRMSAWPIAVCASFGVRPAAAR